MMEAKPNTQLAPAPHRRTIRKFRISTVLLWLVFVCLLPGSIATVALLAREYSNSHEQFERDLISTARAMVQSVDGQLLRAQAVAQVLASSNTLAKKEKDLPTFYERSRLAIDSTQAGLNIVLSDSSGRQLLNTLSDFGAPLPAHGNPDVLVQAINSGQPVISDVYLGPVLRKPLISVDVPVGENGNVRYVISLGMIPSQFDVILNRQALPSNWVSAVFDRNGTIVARTHAADRFVGQKGTPDYIRMIAQSPEGSMQTITREGIPTLSVWSKSPVTGWSVGIGVPRADLETSLTRKMRSLALAIALLLAISLLLAWWASKKIANSIRALTVPAMAMRQGKPLPLQELEILESAEVATAIRDTAQLLAGHASELARAHRLAGFGTWHWDIRSGNITVSESVTDICGRYVPPFPEQRGTFLPIESWDMVKAAADQTVRHGTPYDIEFRVNHGNGSTIWLNQKCDAIRDTDGNVIALHGSVLDITRRKEVELRLEQAHRSHTKELEKEVAERTASLHRINQELQRLNQTDILTHLKNRMAANERLREEYLRMKRVGTPYAVLFIDIDHFKRVNDTFGHDTGDQVLKQLATVLLDQVRATDFVARYGGEEFLILLSDTAHSGALVIAEKIRAVVAEQTFGIAKQQTVSIGVASHNEADQNEEEAVRRADTAMYRAKQEGRNRVCSS